MFRVDLRALVQLSKSTEDPLIRHKRIKCGKVSYMLCYALQNGFLTIRQAKRMSRRSRQPRRQRILRRSSQTWIECVSDASSQTSFDRTCNVETHFPLVVDVESQTPLLHNTHAGVDTLDLSLRVSRHQQTTTRFFQSASSQTKHLKQEGRATQIEVKLKTRWTQTELMTIPTSMSSSTQTMAIVVQQRESFTQTTQSEDEEELLKPHEQVFQLLLRSLSCQSNLLLNGVASINQLVEFKELELQKQRLDAEAQIKAQSAAKLQKLKQLQARRAQKRSKHQHCARNKIRAKPAAEPKQTEYQTQTTQAHTQTEQPVTDCRSSQTEQLAERVVRLAVAATQTDRIKGFSWLRLNS
ncbi:uncharacterized protein LOC135440196 isoform X2 [Drosophila montana]|uniref:uncharacterized protein LOC135440196 isoform X2 n=1 Tax=Drosophila montana TaxID=40370 RepID=UPI00313ECE2D